MDSIQEIQAVQEILEQLLAEMSPEAWQQVEQLLAEKNAASAEPLREVIENILDERITVEEKDGLQKPLLLQRFQPKAPPRQRRGRKRQEPLRMFDPFPAQNNRMLTD